MSDESNLTTSTGDWTVRADLEQALLENGRIRLEQWQRHDQLRVVKTGVHRTVYHLELPEAGLYLKHYKTPGLGCWMKNLIRGSTARREYLRARQIANRGIATITPVALGECRRAGVVSDSYLATREIPRAVQLDAYLETVFPGLSASVQSKVRRQLARQLGDLMAGMHAVGVTHRDLHPGNLLVETESNLPVKLHLIDLQAAGVSGPLGWRRARHNLALFNRWFFQRVNRTDRLRFLRHYADRRPGVITHLHEASRQVERQTVRVALRFWRHTAGRCLRACRDFYRLDGHGRTAFARREVPSGDLSTLLADPEALLAGTDVGMLKHSHDTTVARIWVRREDRVEPWVLKRVKRKAWWHALCRDGPLRRAWQVGHAVADADIPTPQPWVLIESRWRRLGRTAWLFTPWIDGGVTLYEYACSSIVKLPADLRRRTVRELIDQLAGLVRRLHENHFDHRDLKAINFLVAPGASDLRSDADQSRDRDAVTRLILLDLDCVRRRRWLSEARRAKNLARLHVSFRASPLVSCTDKLRFLRRYLPWGLDGGRDWKALWRRIDRLTDRKIRRNLRRGRPIS